MKQKISRPLMGALLCIALGSIVHVFVREHDFAVRLSVVVSNLLFAALVLHGAVQGHKARTAHGETFDELYRNADRALYRAKASGKNQCALPL